MDLASAHLDVQYRLWPDLAERKLLPARNKKSAAQMAGDYRDRFLKVADVSKASVESQSIAAAYLRYSSDKSNPQSLAQQLRSTLERAKTRNSSK